MHYPAVSVVIASYNYGSYLEAAIQSVLDQSWQDFEILVVDDGSTDNSMELANACATRDSRIRVLHHEDGRNHGLSATLQLGIKAAQGDYVAFLESDDLWHQDCLQQRFAMLQSVQDAGVVFNNIDPLPMPGSDTDWFQSYVPRVMREHGRRSTSSNRWFSLRTALLFENKIPTFSCSMVRRELLSSCTLISPVPRWLDWWLWIQLAEKTTFCFVPEKLTLWRLHAKSYNHRVSSSYFAEGAFFWKEVRKRRLKRGILKADRRDLPVLLPFCSVPLLRFFLIVKECGLRATYERILKRL